MQNSNVPLLTKIFTDFCAITALKLAIINLPQEEQNIVKEELLARWESDAVDIFNRQLLAFKEHIKTIPSTEKLQAGLNLETFEKGFKRDLIIAKTNIVEMLGLNQIESKDAIKKES